MIAIHEIGREDKTRSIAASQVSSSAELKAQELLHSHVDHVFVTLQNRGSCNLSAQVHFLVVITDKAVSGTDQI